MLSILIYIINYIYLFVDFCINGNLLIVIIIVLLGYWNKKIKGICVFFLKFKLIMVLF